MNATLGKAEGGSMHVGRLVAVATLAILLCAPSLAAEAPLRSLAGATGWINARALGADDLRGKVVVVQFWTYTCVNWLRTLPYVRAWAGKYEKQGVVFIGIHTPEFPFEEDQDNVQRAVSQMGISYPVAVDSRRAGSKPNSPSSESKTGAWAR